MSLQQVRVSVRHDTTATIPEDVRYRIAYGSAGFVEHYDEDAYTTYCKTEDGECKFILSEVSDESVMLTIIAGDEEKVKQLVKAEIDHFDANTIFV